MSEKHTDAGDGSNDAKTTTKLTGGCPDVPEDVETLSHNPVEVVGERSDTIDAYKAMRCVWCGEIVKRWETQFNYLDEVVYPDVDVEGMGDKPDDDNDAKETHADVTTLNESLAIDVLENINWMRYADIESGQPSLVVGFGITDAGHEHPEIYMNMGRPTGDVWSEDLEDVTFQHIQKHLIHYYKLEVGQGGLTVRKSSPDRAPAERIVPEGKDSLLEFETVDVPVWAVDLTGLSAAMNRLEANSELSKRETQAFVLEAVGLSDGIIGKMLGVAPDTVKEYKYRIKNKIVRYQTTLNWLEGMQTPEAEYV